MALPRLCSFVIAGHSASTRAFRRVNALVTRQSILLSKIPRKKMDARVKPGHDGTGHSCRKPLRPALADRRQARSDPGGIVLERGSFVVRPGRRLPQPRLAH